MFAGPIFARDALTLPRQFRHYLIRSGYIGLLFVLIWTAGQTTFGFQDVRGISAMASFGNLVFQILGFVQLTLVLFFSLLFTVGNIAQEKDRQTLILLLMTDLSNHEIVLGKLLSSLLQVGTLILASVPVFIFLRMLGGVGTDQVLWLIALCAVTAVLSGSWAAMVAFWREKTFQTLATSVLGVVVFLGLLEALIAIVPPDSVASDWLAVCSPYRALVGIMSPLASQSATGVGQVSAVDSIVALGLLAAVMIAVTIQRLRVWNPSRSVFIQPETTKDSSEGEARQVVRHRRIWSNPVIWREIRTRAYGRRMIVIKLAYLLMAAFVFQRSIIGGGGQELVLGMLSRPAFAFVGLSILGLMLINAQAVTSITSERDGKTLDLLLATDISAGEFIYGKLGGIAYNTRELILVPLALAAWQAAAGDMLWETFAFMTLGFLILVAFAAMLGLHSSLTFEGSRAAIGNSLGTLFFLFIGIFVFLMLLVEASGSLASQLLSFVVFIGLGSICLWASLTHKNPSPALTLAAGWLPFMTFYSITEFLREGTLSVCLAIVAVYGFTSLAMLVPAVSAFDVALGRTTGDRG